MNLEKYTDRAKGFLQAAQTVAIRLNHQRITTEHISKPCSRTSRAWQPA
jgi:ATP-dependent Clp protease ATP-binding subunit ClpB